MTQWVTEEEDRRFRRMDLRATAFFVGFVLPLSLAPIVLGVVTAVRTTRDHPELAVGAWLWMFSTVFVLVGVNNLLWSSVAWVQRLRAGRAYRREESGAVERARAADRLSARWITGAFIIGPVGFETYAPVTPVVRATNRAALWLWVVGLTACVVLIAVAVVAQ
jgi:hypothetical protein